MKKYEGLLDMSSPEYSTQRKRLVLERMRAESAVERFTRRIAEIDLKLKELEENGYKNTR
jgi:hypothetical protein